MIKRDFKIKKLHDDALIKILGQRVIVMFTESFQELARGMQDAIGTEAEGVLYDAGIYSGKNSTKVLLKSWKERGKAFLEKWKDFYSSSGVGWFKIKDIDIDLDNGTGYILLIQSFAAEKYREINDNTKLTEKNMKTINPLCHFLTGFFVGVFEELTRKKIECKEVKCVTKKDVYCEFQLTNY